MPIYDAQGNVMREPDEVWSEAQVAEYFGYSRRTIRRWRRAGHLLWLRLPGGRIAYRADSIREAVAEWEHR